VDAEYGGVRCQEQRVSVAAGEELDAGVSLAVVGLETQRRAREFDVGRAKYCGSDRKK
jgi:hypothetical protein